MLLFPSPWTFTSWSPLKGLGRLAPTDGLFELASTSEGMATPIQMTGFATTPPFWNVTATSPEPLLPGAASISGRKLADCGVIRPLPRAWILEPCDGDGGAGAGVGALAAAAARAMILAGLGDGGGDASGDGGGDASGGGSAGMAGSGALGVGALVVGDSTTAVLAVAAVFLAGEGGGDGLGQA